MALNVVQNPKLVTPAYNDNYVIVSSTLVNDKYSFFYLFDFYVSRVGQINGVTQSYSTTPSISLKVLPNPINQSEYVAGYGELNVNKVIQDLTQFDRIDFGNEAIIGNTLNNNCLRYKIDVFEVYSNGPALKAEKIEASKITIGDYYIIDGVLYNEQYWDFDEDLISYNIKTGFIPGTDPVTKFLTNRPETSDTALVDSLHIICGGTNSFQNDYGARPLARQPNTQPAGWEIEWLVESEGVNNVSLSLEATAAGEPWTSKVLAICGGYWRYILDQDGNPTNDYFLQVSGNPTYFGEFRKFRKGTQLKNIQLVFELTLSTLPFSTHNGMIQILGRTPGTSNWTVLTTSNSTTQGDTQFDYIIGFPNITLTNNYDELGIRFVSVPYDGAGVYQMSEGWFTYETASSTAAILVKGYDADNNLMNIDEFVLTTDFKAQGVKWNSLYLSSLDLSYIRVFTYICADDVIDEDKLLILSEVKTIKAACKYINNVDTKTLVWQNRLGAWDSFEFNLVQAKESTIRKDPYFIPLDKLSTRETAQRKSTGRDFNQVVTVTTNNISKQNIDWLKELLDTEYVYEVRIVNNEYRLIPIYITTNSVTEKPYNNLYGQFKIAYNYSQIEPVR